MRTIKSTKGDIDLLRLSALNYMNEIYEMIGIYQEYLQIGNINEEFLSYYETYVGTTEYHYVNKGTFLISGLLQQNNKKESRRNIRRLGRTYKGFPVVLSTKADIIIITALEYISSMDALKEVYLRKLHNGNVDNPLDFQYELLLRYARRRQIENKLTPLKQRVEEVEWEVNE